MDHGREGYGGDCPTARSPGAALGSMPLIDRDGDGPPRTGRAVRRTALDILLGLASPDPRVRALAYVVAGAALLAVGAADRLTGPQLSLAVVYLLPPAAAAVVGRLGPSVLLAAEGAVVWALLSPAQEAVPATWRSADALVRFVAVSAVLWLIAALKSLSQQAKESETRSRDFLSLATHQLRTPLTGLRASAEALLALGASPAQERMLANVAREADRAGRLVAMLLKSARLDEGAVPPAEAVDVPAVCRVELDRLCARAPHLHVRLDVADPPPPRSRVGREAVRDIVANLVENAGRHAASEVIIAVTGGSGAVTVRVNDDGPGVPPGAEERIFERFVTLDGRGGTGLGLALARGLARQRRGDVAYRNGGFVVTLPADRAPDASADDGPRPGPDASADDGPPRPDGPGRRGPRPRVPPEQEIPPAGIIRGAAQGSDRRG